MSFFIDRGFVEFQILKNMKLALNLEPCGIVLIKCCIYIDIDKT